MSKKPFSVLFLALTAALPGTAAIQYEFTFTELSSGHSDFTVTLLYPTYVTTTGMNPYSGAPLATNLGYNVNYTGTQDDGGWGFAPDSAAILGDNLFNPNGSAFLFRPPPGHSGYITSPGVYVGSILASAPTFIGSARLVVTDTNQPAVPEPSTVCLVAAALGAAGLFRRRISV